MKNLKIRFKILIPMLALLFMVMGLLTYLILTMGMVNDQSTVISQNWLPSVQALGEINTDTSDFRISEYGQMTSLNDEERVRYDQIRAAEGKKIDDERKKYEGMISSPEEKKLYQEFSTLWDQYIGISKTVDDLYESGQKDKSVELLEGNSKVVFDKASDKLSELTELNSKGADNASKEGDLLYSQANMIAISLAIALLFVGFVIVYILVKSISTPITKITDYMVYLSGGNLDQDVPSRELKDEIGDMARSVQIFKDNMVRAKDLEAAEIKERAAKEARQKNVDSAIKKFELSMADIVKFVASASTELQASAQSLSASAEETSKQSGAVSVSSQQAAANVQTVASATEELSSSINEIASQVSRSSQVANQAVHDAEAAGVSVSELVAAAQKIGDVTKIISGIAEQTNLLALNATIEAARAGDAGKGFAVVAAEVKNLANESAKATEEISSQISQIQSISQASAESINMICKIIREMDEISGSISSAIQEQTSATQEISRNVTEAYTGTSEVTQNIASVSEAADSTGSASHQVLSAADELSRQSSILKEEFDVFIKELEAA